MSWEEVRDAARGRWNEILPHFGVGEEFLREKKKTSCPWCGGTDRFEFKNRESTGSFWCEQCGHGDGFEFVQRAKNLPDRKDAIRTVAEHLGLSTVKPKQRSRMSVERMAKRIEECVDISPKNACGRYLKNRNLEIPDCVDIGHHPGVTYYEYEGADANGKPILNKLGVFPAMVCKITRPDGKPAGIHTTHLTESGDKAPVPSVRKLNDAWEGALIGSAIRIDEAGKRLGIGEGVETTLYIKQATKLPMWSGINASLMAQIEVPDEVEELFIFADNDVKGITEATKLAERYRTKKKVKLIIPPTAGNDWDDERTLSAKLVEKHSFFDPWDEPQKLSTLLPVPAFDIENLPQCAWEYVLDVRETIQCPLDYPAIASLITISVAVGSGVSMRPRMKAAFPVIPNLWGAVIGGASRMKSPGTGTVFSILKSLDVKERAAYNKEMGRYKGRMRSFELRAEGIKQAMRSVAKQLASRPEKQADYDLLDERLKELEEPEPPKCRRFRVKTVTTKALQALMADNPRGIFVCRDELAGLIQFLDDPRNGEDRGFWLESWNGWDDSSDDTISRKNSYSPTCATVLFGGIHPHKIKSVVKQTLKMGSDGMLARFQLLVYPDGPMWVDRDEFEDQEAKRRFATVVEMLAYTDFVEFGAVPVEGKIPYFQFTTEAGKLWSAWHKKLKTEKTPPNKEDLTLEEEHLAKYPSLCASLAVLIHLAEMADKKSQLIEHKGDGPLTEAEKRSYSQSVSLEATQKAIALCDYLEAHMRRIYALAHDARDEITSTLANAIRNGELESEFTMRVLKRTGYVDEDNEIKAFVALDRLVAAKWLRVHETNKTTKWEINPRIKNFKAESFS